jgi:hypothetical protein
MGCYVKHRTITDGDGVREQSDHCMGDAAIDWELEVLFLRGLGRELTTGVHDGVYWYWVRTGEGSNRIAYSVCHAAHGWDSPRGGGRRRDVRKQKAW